MVMVAMRGNGSCEAEECGGNLHRLQDCDLEEKLRNRGGTEDRDGRGVHQIAGASSDPSVSSALDEALLGKQLEATLATCVCRFGAVIPASG